MRWTWAAILVTAACAGSPSSNGVHEYGTDDGGACVRSHPSMGTLVRVDFDDCLACSGEQDLACTVTVDGDRVVVDAGGTVDTSGCGSSDTCWPAGVDCGSVDLAEGTYTLVYGADEVSFTLPLADEVCTSPVPSRQGPATEARTC